MATLIAVEAVSPDGFYRSTTIEVGAAIELEPDGKFAYALDYGAVAEVAEGRWRLDGNRILLVPSRVEGIRSQPLDATPLTIAGDTLLLERHGRAIRFERDGPPVIPERANRKLERGR